MSWYPLSKGKFAVRARVVTPLKHGPRMPQKSLWFMFCNKEKQFKEVGFPFIQIRMRAIHMQTGDCPA